MRWKGASLAFVLTLCSPPAALSPLAAQPLTPAPPKEVAFEQKLGQQVPLDLPFRDENGTNVLLRDYAGEKPIVLSLVYYECPMLCGLSMTGLASTMKALTWSAGKEFQVVTVSFDPSEGPALAKGKKDSLLSIYTRTSARTGWHFLTGHEEEIKKLTAAVGFRYVWDADQKQFAHATGVVVLTPDGRVSRYLFGVDVPARDLKLALIEAADGKIGGLSGQLLLLCYHYDPKTGRYGAAAMNLMRAGGAVTLLGVGGFLFVLQRRRRREVPENG